MYAMKKVSLNMKYSHLVFLAVILQLHFPALGAEVFYAVRIDGDGIWVGPKD